MYTLRVTPLTSMISSFRLICGHYTARNATPTDLLQVVDFTGLLQVVNKLQQVCWILQVAASLWKSYLLQLDICRLAASCRNNLNQTCEKKVSIINLQQTCWQLAANLLSSSRSNRCERILISAWWQQGNKPTADLLQLACFWLCRTP